MPDMLFKKKRKFLVPTTCTIKTGQWNLRMRLKNALNSMSERNYCNKKLASRQVYTSPSADILKLLQSIFRSFATKKVYKGFTNWTLGVNHTHQGFLLFFWSGSLRVLCLSWRHVFRLLICTLSNHLQTNKETMNSDHPVLKCTVFYFKPRKQ